MKKLISLLLITIMLTSLVSCDLGGEVDTEPPIPFGTETETPTEIGTGNETEAPEEDVVETDVSDELKYADHEMHDFFDLLEKEKADPVAIASKIDGDLTSIDPENLLVVIESKTVDALDYETKTVKVYDLLTGEVIREDSVKSPYGNTPLKEVERISVTLHYPVIRVEKTTYAEQGEGEAPKQQKSVSYYIAEKDGELVYTTSDTSFDYYEYQNGLVCFLMGDKYVWIDGEKNVIRSVETIAANYNYAINPDMFDSEYKGYLYSFSETGLMVFNHAGFVSAKYTVAEMDKSYVNCFVLDDGNVLVQEFTDVGAYNSCDFVLSGTRYTMKSMIVNAVDGTITDVELDFVVDYVETEYMQDSDVLSGLTLANGRDNLVIAYKVANGAISAYASLCVMDNSGEVVYTVKNDTFGVDFRFGIEYIGREKYVACMNTNGYFWDAIFDIDGNFISAYKVNEAYRTDKYIVSNNVIYSYDMAPVFDFAKDGYVLLDVINDTVYLEKVNYEAGTKDWYRYIGGGKTEFVASDVEWEVYNVVGDLLCVYDIDDELYKVCTIEGEELLVSNNTADAMYLDEGIYLIRTSFEGESIVYVVK